MILSTSKSAADFAARIKALSRHAHDEHEWDEGKCDFHSSCVCSCGMCGDNEQLQVKERTITLDAPSLVLSMLWLMKLNAIREHPCLNSLVIPFLKEVTPIGWKLLTVCSFALDQSTST